MSPLGNLVRCFRRVSSIVVASTVTVGAAACGQDRNEVGARPGGATTTAETGGQGPTQSASTTTSSAAPTSTAPKPTLTPSSATTPWPAGVEISLDVPGHADRPTLLLHGAGATVPLVVVFHGSGGTIENIKERSDLHVLARDAGVALLWLSGKPIPDRHWNTQSTCCGPAYEQRIDDFPYIDASLDAVRSLGLRPSAFLATGVSAGAGMAVTVACNRRKVFSTVISVGGWRPISCTDRRLSLVAIGGTADEVFGGDGARRLARQWGTAVLRCSSRRTETRVGIALVTEWNACPDGGFIRLVEVDGLKHVWPRTPDFDASEEIIRTALAA